MIVYFKDGFLLKDLQFDWIEKNAVTISEKLEMPDFVLVNHVSRRCEQKTATGKK